MTHSDPPGVAPGRPAGGKAIGPRRALVAFAALAYLVFVVYGSLVPLDYRPRPLDEALRDFRAMPWLDLGAASRADWVANLLLFVPLAYLWTGALWSRAVWARIVTSALVLVACAALSLGIEFTQLFFPPRTVSLNDVAAECLGAMIGVLAWWGSGERVLAWLAGWSQAHGAPSVAQRLLYGYLFVLFAYNLLPLDLTLSPVEFFHKWREGRILLVPFSAAYASLPQMIYDLATDVAVWVPVAFLARLAHGPGAATRRPRTDAAVLAGVVAAAVVLEALQLFVYSRVTDLTDILTGAAGAWLGIVLARGFGPGGAGGQSAATRAAERDSAARDGAARDAAGRRATPAARAIVLWLLALLATLAALAVIFWYPFDFRTDWGFVHPRAAALKRMPFTTYYYGTEFRAITEVLHKVGFFAPLGALLGGAALWIRRRLRLPAVLLHLIAAGILACVAAAIEAGQLFLPGKFADPTDWALETLGGIAGYFALGWLARRIRG